MKSIIDPPSPFAPASEWAGFRAQMRTMPPEDVRNFAYLADDPEQAVQGGSASRGETPE